MLRIRIQIYVNGKNLVLKGVISDNKSIDGVSTPSTGVTYITSTIVNNITTDVSNDVIVNCTVLPSAN